MNIEELKKRKELVENNLKILNEKITQDTQNAFRLQGAIMDMNEIINEEEKKMEKELEKEKDKKNENVEQKKKVK